MAEEDFSSAMSLKQIQSFSWIYKKKCDFIDTCSGQALNLSEDCDRKRL